jgi:hypothetical protein
VKNETRAIDVQSEGEMIEKVYKEVKILNEKGRDWAQEVIYYNKFSKIRNLTGMILGADSTVIQPKLKDANIEDQSAVSGFSLYEDGRIKIISLFGIQYPYTVIFSYEIVHDGFIDFPSWIPQYPDAPVRYSKYQISVPNDYNIRYYKRGLEIEPIIQNTATRKGYIFEIRDQPKLEVEPMSPRWSQMAPAILFAPSHFKIANVEGYADSWKSLGEWYNLLQNGRQELSPEKIYMLKTLVADAKDDMEKVRLIYDHLQNTTRYVSVQLGIGGWQTYDAKYVERNQYGDCKALTNYMLSMLQAVDIKAYPALVRAGENVADVAADFPSQQFNHVILAIPKSKDEKDLLWLENTSQTQAFGHLGAFTEDRNVLMITPEGGVLVHTPKTASSENQQQFKAEVQLEDTGNATFVVKAHYTGNKQDELRGMLATKPPRDQELWLRNEATDLPNMEIVSTDFEDLKQRKLNLDLQFAVNVPRYAGKSGTRLFFKPNALNRQKNTLPSVEQRRMPIVFPSTQVETDEVRFQLPVGYAPEAVPSPTLLETPFARYEARIEVVPNSLIYRRTLELKESKLSASTYNALKDFIKQVTLVDQAQVVLKKTN